jgi:hypothetical protein
MRSIIECLYLVTGGPNVNILPDKNSNKYKSKMTYKLEYYKGPYPDISTMV